MIQIKVAIIADDPLVSSSLEQVLLDDPRFTVTTTISFAGWLDAGNAFTPPDVTLIDLGWNTPRAREIIENLPQTDHCLILIPESVTQEDTRLRNFSGVLSRVADAEKVTAALSAVYAGLNVRENIQHPPLLPGDDHPGLVIPVEGLTPRELDVLTCMFEGLSNKLIASRLKISEHTAKFHVTSILGKLNAQSRTEAVVRAVRLGLIRM